MALFIYKCYSYKFKNLTINLEKKIGEFKTIKESAACENFLKMEDKPYIIPDVKIWLIEGNSGLSCREGKK